MRKCKARIGRRMTNSQMSHLPNPHYPLTLINSCFLVVISNPGPPRASYFGFVFLDIYTYTPPVPVSVSIIYIYVYKLIPPHPFLFSRQKLPRQGGIAPRPAATPRENNPNTKQNAKWIYNNYSLRCAPNPNPNPNAHFIIIFSSNLLACYTSTIKQQTKPKKRKKNKKQKKTNKQNVTKYASEIFLSIINSITR